MKRTLCMVAGLAMLFFSINVAAQNILERTKEKVKAKVNQRADEKIDKAIDKGMDQAEDATKNKEANDQKTAANVEASGTSATPTVTAYSKYDFVPGDKIIFQDDLKSEKEGEFPSQFDASGGQGQIYIFNGEKVFQRLADYTIITPRIKGMDYLPDQYTIEFDAYMEGSGENMKVKFTGTDNEVSLSSHDAELGNFTGQVPNEVYQQWYPEVSNYQWRHYAIAVNKTLLKAYIDQFRVLNVPSFNGKATAVAFDFSCSSDGAGDCKNMFLKNFRIASGGIDLYKKVEMEGKIVTHGILFDIDKATLKPESMGTINSIYELLKTNPSLKFEIDGHTDNSGTGPHNLSLSKLRADAVKAQLVTMGIDASRLTTKGLGDTKPMNDNNTPEGKANNRRVEFVKI